MAHRVTQFSSVQTSPLHFYCLSGWPAAAAPGSCCKLDTCGCTESSQSVLLNRFTNFIYDSSALWLCTSVRLSLVRHSSVSRLYVSLSPGPFFLSVRVSLSPSLFFPVGLRIRVGRAVLDPHQGPVAAGLVLALGLGRGPVAVTAFGAWWRGAARPGAGRRSRATCMPEACGSASEWRMVPGGTHEGQQGVQLSMVWIWRSTISL